VLLKDNVCGGGRRGLGLIVIAALLWGTVGVTTRALFGLSETNALSIGFLRLAISVPALLAACAGSTDARRVRVARADLGLMLLLGAALAFYQVCFFAAIALAGLGQTSATAASTATLIEPLASATLAWLLFSEQLGPLGLLGGALLLGALVLLSGWSD
jgi:DME family drug/metabolite transporter